QLRKEYEPRLAQYDKIIKGDRDGFASAQYKAFKAKLERIIVRKKHGILTDHQRKTLGYKVVTPAVLQEQALSDPKVWDLGQLEKQYTIESRSYDPEEQVVSFMVITKRKFTEKEKQADADNWSGSSYYEPRIKVIFYDKNDETVLTKPGPHAFR